MSSKANKSEIKKGTSMLEIAFINPVVAKGKEIFGEITEAKHILEYSISQAEMIINLEDNGIDKNGDRYDLDSKEIIGIKGSTKKPRRGTKAVIESIIEGIKAVKSEAESEREID